MSGHDRPALRRSRRLTTIVPAADWIGMGYSPLMAHFLEKLQRDIEGRCEQCRDGAALLALLGTRGADGRYSVRVNVPHHDLLLPHWTKLAHAVKGRTAPVGNFLVVGISLPPSVLDVILPSLQSCQVTKINLLCPNMGMPGLLRLSSFIRDNTTMESLSIGAEKFTDISAVGCFSDAIASHPSLQSIVLCDCGLNDAEFLRRVINGCKRLIHVSFMHNCMESDAVAIVGDFISGNHCVTTLGLRRTNISDRDAEILAAALKTNKHLQHLDLRKNDITAFGRKTLIKALFDTSSIDALVESNHTCVVNTYDLDDTEHTMQEISDTEAQIISINGDKEITEGENIIEKAVLALRAEEELNINGNNAMCERMKIRKKTVLTLCGEEELFDLGYFNDVSQKLMPRVLELIQEHTRLRSDAVSQSTLDRDALSRVFHTLRGWEMPSPFENLQKPLKRAKKRTRNGPR